MLKKIVTIVVSTLLLFALTTADAMTGIYIGGQLGYVQQESNSTLDNGSLNQRSDEHFGWYGAMGYNYELDDQLALSTEVGYGEYGETQWKDSADNKVRAHQTAVLVLLVARYKFIDMIRGYLKAGVAFGATDINVGGTSSISQNRYNNSPPVTVIGASYDILPELTANLEWQHIFGTKIRTTDTNEFQATDAIMAGLTYTFEL